MARASRMLRQASDHSAGHRSSSDYFNFHPAHTTPSESSGSLHPMMALDLSNREGPSSRAASTLLGYAFSEAAAKPKKKVSKTSVLASAFHTPALSYPSPISLKKKKTSPAESLMSKKQRLDFDSASEGDLDMKSSTSSPTPGAGFHFPSTTLTTPSGRNTVAVSPARANFYLGGVGAQKSSSGISLTSSASSSSWAPSSYFSSYASSDASASTISLNSDSSMGMRTPSPMSSVFDLNELSLGKEDDEEREVPQDETPFKGWNWGR